MAGYSTMVWMALTATCLLWVALPAAAQDADGDGYTCGNGDCNDNDATVYPGATEMCDGVDNDCDGNPASYECDNDGDGWMQCEECDDNDPSNYPGVDLDNDGYAGGCCGDDCDDLDPNVHPGVDLDNDGYDVCDGGDCNDLDPNANPGATEIPYNGIDEDCDGEDLTDVDGDGWSAGDDCDDSDASIYPGTDELCDGIDNNCDGAIDEGCGDDDDSDGDDDDSPGDDDTVGDDDYDSSVEVDPSACDCGAENRGGGFTFGAGLLLMGLAVCRRPASIR